MLLAQRKKVLVTSDSMTQRTVDGKILSVSFLDQVELEVFNYTIKQSSEVPSEKSRTIHVSTELHFKSKP